MQNTAQHYIAPHYSTRLDTTTQRHKGFHLKNQAAMRGKAVAEYLRWLADKDNPGQSASDYLSL